jgi:hypothetical protein
MPKLESPKRKVLSVSPYFQDMLNELIESDVSGLIPANQEIARYLRDLMVYADVTLANGKTFELDVAQWLDVTFKMLTHIEGTKSKVIVDGQIDHNIHDGNPLGDALSDEQREAIRRIIVGGTDANYDIPSLPEPPGRLCEDGLPDHSGEAPQDLDREADGIIEGDFEEA